jgi:hypothetical protein
MTLCISYKHFNRIKYDQAVTISDSRLTVLKKKQIPNETALNILPTNTFIAHQNDCGIKLHLIKHRNKRNERDIAFAVAGAVSLGIQSILHLEATFLGLMGEQTFEQTVVLIDKTIDKFWENAYDKEIEYLITLADDNNSTRIFRKIGKSNEIFTILEVKSENGITLGVIGDNSELIRSNILGEVNKLLIINNTIPIESALASACGRALRREIENEDNSFVGGNIQGIGLKGRDGFYMTIQYKEGVSFRGIYYGNEVYLDEFPSRYPTWPYDSNIYDPKIELELIAKKLIT